MSEKLFRFLCSLNNNFSGIGLSYGWNGEYIEYIVVYGDEVLFRCGNTRGMYFVSFRNGLRGSAISFEAVKQTIMDFLGEEIGYSINEA